MQTLVYLARAARHRLRRVPWEALVWTAGLAAMACLDPSTREAGWCLFQRLGLDGCPGCGLGHAIAYLARGDLGASVEAHPLGLPVVGVLLWRVGTVLRDVQATAPEAFSRAR